MASHSAPSSSTSTLRAAGAMGLATLISRFLGLAREQVFAVLFGASHAMDAFNIAFRIPNLLRDLFAEGAMSAALVPTFIEVREKRGRDAAWRLAGLVFRVLFGWVAVISVLGIVFSESLVDFYASSYRGEPGKFELTVQLTRVLFPFFPFVALAAAFMGILNACGVFFIPAFSSAVFNGVSIGMGVGAAWAFPSWGRPAIEGMAWGVVIGGVAQALIQLPYLYQKGYRRIAPAADDPRWYRDPGLRRMLTMMVPGTVGLAATQVNILVNSILATAEGVGAVSWLNYAFRLMQFPIGVFGVSLAVATLPRVSQYWVTRDVDSIRDTLTQSLKTVFAINLPAAAGLAFLGVPIISLIFEYGRFGTQDTAATAQALAAYAVGLTAYSAVKVLVPACYGLGNTRLPVISSVVSVAVNIPLSLVLCRFLGFWGLALATSVTAFANAIFLLFAIRRLLAVAGGAFPLVPIFKSFLLHSVVALLMGLTCWGVSQTVLVSWLGSHWGARMIHVALSVGLGVWVVVLAAWVFRIEESLAALRVITGKIKRKLS